MLWLITGGCGFVGRNLIRMLKSRPGVKIRVVDDLSSGRREELAAIAPDVELIEGDVRNESLAIRAGSGADVIVHLGANTGVPQSVADPRYDCLVNVTGTLNYLESCRENGIKRFVFASSNAPIGDCEPPIHEEITPHPLSPYGASKLAGEAYCSAYNHSFGVDTVALRFGNCYGPLSSHKSSVVAKFIRQAKSGEPWEIYGDGGQTRDFVYVDDVVDAIIRSAEREGVGGHIFQIATNTETTVNELADRLMRILRKHGVAVSEPRQAPVRTGDITRNFSDVRKAERMLGWHPQVNLDEGLERTVSWFLSGKAP